MSKKPIEAGLTIVAALIQLIVVLFCCAFVGLIILSVIHYPKSVTEPSYTQHEWSITTIQRRTITDKFFLPDGKCYLIAGEWHVTVSCQVYTAVEIGDDYVSDAWVHEPILAPQQPTPSEEDDHVI